MNFSSRKHNHCPLCNKKKLLNRYFLIVLKQDELEILKIKSFCKECFNEIMDKKYILKLKEDFGINDETLERLQKYKIIPFYKYRKSQNEPHIRYKNEQIFINLTPNIFDKIGREYFMIIENEILYCNGSGYIFKN